MNATQGERIVRATDKNTQKLIAKMGTHFAIECFRCCCWGYFFFFSRYSIICGACLQENYTHEFGRTSPQVNCSWLEYDVSKIISILPLES